MNNTELKEQHDKLLASKTKADKERKIKKYKYAKTVKKVAEKEKYKRDILISKKIESIKSHIWNNVKASQLKRRYNTSIKLYNNKIKSKKRGRQKDLSYNKYEQYMKDEMYRYIKDNVLTETYSYIFSNKKLHITKADAGAFKDETINRKMDNIDVNDIIKKFAHTFFDR